MTGQTGLDLLFGVLIWDTFVSKDVEASSSLSDSSEVKLFLSAKGSRDSSNESDDE